MQAPHPVAKRGETGRAESLQQAVEARRTLPGPPFFTSGVGSITQRRDTPIATTDARINERIRAREVRLVGPNGDQIGVKPLPEALHIAREHDLDLVEVAPNANPPVCKIMDFGKFKYEQDVQRKESRRKATNVVIKEMKFRPKIDEHDYTTKTKHVERFLAEGSKVKITIMFRGREMAHPELGKRILDRIAEQVRDIGIVESAPRAGRAQHGDGAAPGQEGRGKAARPVAAGTATPTPAPGESPPAEQSSVESPPVESPPVESPPVDAAGPVEPPPVEPPAAELPSAAPSEAATATPAP